MASEVRKIAADSLDSVDDGFDHFATPITATSIERGKYEEILPLSGGSHTDMIEFLMQKGEGVYTDMSKSYLRLNVRVVQGNGAALDNTPANMDVWYQENLAHSLFQKVTVSVNSKDVEYMPDYAMQSFIYNAINYDEDTQKTTMFASSGWLTDSAVSKDGADHTNEEIAVRRAYIRGSLYLSFFVRLRSGFLNSDRLLFPGYTLGIKLTRTSPNFCLAAASNNPGHGAKVEIHNCSFFAYRVKANDALFKAQMDMMLEGARLKFPMRRIKTQTRMLTAGSTHQNIELLNQKQRPNRLIVALVNSEAYSGRYHRSPYKFPNCDVSRIELNVEGMGESTFYEPNFTTGENLARPYAALAALVGRYDTDKPFPVSMKRWRESLCLWAFDLTADRSHTDAFQLMRSGRLDLRIHFNTALADNMTALLMMEHDDMVTMGLDNDIELRVPLL